LPPADVAGLTDAVIRVVLEPFWPTRRVMAFDELCRRAV
jgi:hypothetical protein